MTGGPRVDRRAILEDVAAGRLAPREAARLLGGTRDSPGGSDGGEPARLVRLRISYRSVDVVADPGVAEVLVVSGSHSLRREGGAVLVTGPDEPGGFAYSGAPAGTRLALRVNPRVDVDVEITGGALRLWGLRGAVRAVARASASTFEDVSGPLDLRVSAGSARISGAPVTGEWAVRAHSATVRMSLLAHADVSVLTVARHSSAAVLDGRDPAVLGAGRHPVRFDLTYSDLVVEGP